MMNIATKSTWIDELTDKYKHGIKTELHRTLENYLRAN